MALASSAEVPPDDQCESVISTLQPNARSDRGDTLDVVEVPQEGQREGVGG